jgi:hypothetical protein
LASGCSDYREFDNVRDNLVTRALKAALAREAHISPLGCWPNTAVVPTVPAR